MIQTETIDISYVQKVLKVCPNYDSIVNYSYEYGDEVSCKLIDWYRELVFKTDTSNNKDLQMISFIDKCLNMYITDRRYKKGLIRIIKVDEINLNNDNLIKTLIMKIISYTNNYEKKKILEITSCKWL